MRMQRVFSLPARPGKTRNRYSGLLVGFTGFLVYQITIIGSAGILLAQSQGTGAQRNPSAPAPASAGSKPEPAAATGPNLATRARVIETYGQLPLNFEPNRGQTDSQVKFLSRARGYTLFLTGTEAVLRLRASKSAVESPKSKNTRKSVV